MSMSLYSAFVPTCLQVLGSMHHLLEKAESFCQEGGMTEEQIIQAKLADDMLPFHFQIGFTVMHSIGAVESLESGVFTPDTTPPPTSLSELKNRVAEAIVSMKALKEQDLNNYIGKPMLFEFKEYRVPFNAENFLLSFSQPNFFFHATTAYDLLRTNGVKIGKMDFLGKMRVA